MKGNLLDKIKSSALLRRRAKRYVLPNPPFLAADVRVFRRALSVGVTFLDATGVNPAVQEAITSDVRAKFIQLCPATFVRIFAFEDVLIIHFVFSPSVRENSILGRFQKFHLKKLKSQIVKVGHINQPHLDGFMSGRHTCKEACFASPAFKSRVRGVSWAAWPARKTFL